MGHWTFWDWIAYTILGITALTPAVQEALRRIPMVRAAIGNHLPRFFKSPVWSFAPLMLFLVGSGVLFARDMGYLGQHSTRVDAADITGSISPARFSEGEMPPWLINALREYDQSRFIGRQSNPRIMEYLKAIPGGETADDKGDWASAFAEWCLNQSGFNGPKDMKPKAWVTWGKQIMTPKLGAIAVFNFQGTEHIGFILADTEDSLVVIGGNQVDRVQVRRYFKRDLLDYRMPASDVLKADRLTPNSH